MDELKKYKDYKTVLSVNILIWCKGKVLMLKRSKAKTVDPGLYSSIGGKVEPGESFYNALIREVKEETGIDHLDNIRMYGVTQHTNTTTKAEWINVSFTATLKSEIALPPSEDGSFEWINPNQIDDLETVHDMKAYIKILNANKKVTILSHFDHTKPEKNSGEIIKIFND